MRTQTFQKLLQARLSNCLQSDQSQTMKKRKRKAKITWDGKSISRAYYYSVCCTAKEVTMKSVSASGTSYSSLAWIRYPGRIKSWLSLAPGCWSWRRIGRTFGALKEYLRILQRAPKVARKSRKTLETWHKWRRFLIKFIKPSLTIALVIQVAARGKTLSKN